MNKKFSGIGVSLIVAAAVTISAFVPPQNDRNPKGQSSQNQGKGNQKGNQDKGNQGNKGNQGKENQGNQGKENQGKNTGNPKKDVDVVDVRGNDQSNKGKGNKTYRIADNGYSWTPVTFRDRRKIRGSEKVTICHKFSRGSENPVTINVSSNAMKAHLNHGDVMGTCPPVATRRFSDIFERRRNDYYNVLINGEDQVYYSQSILDYALDRLAASRLQLVQYQSSNMSPVVIERRQAMVVELEQNVSLLETLLAAAAAVVIDRL
jgi:hypothetical protein